MNRPLRWIVGVLGLLLSLGAVAHKPSDSYLSLSLEQGADQLSGQWDIALRDLDFVLGIDRNRDAKVTWGEVLAARAEIEGHAFPSLNVHQGEQSCPIVARDLLVNQHSDGAYAVLQFTVDCPRRIDHIGIEYRLFFDVDQQHKGLLKLSAMGGHRSAVFSADTPRQNFELTQLSAWQHFTDYTSQGVWHIWIGVDHILFLLALLLPAVLVWEYRRYLAARSFRPALLEVIKIVTAFTIAHSITLTAATLGWIDSPSRLIESVIALSVVLAAINNLLPKISQRGWRLAFAFGLIHGFGFASVLMDLGLPDTALLVALLGFNFGVELGQLAIVAAFLPLAYLMRSTRFYSQMVLRGGSIAIALVAGLWFIERAFNLKFMPF